MAIYKLIKKGEVINTIVADQAVIDSISKDYDSVELVEPPVVEPVEGAAAPKVVSPVEFKLLFTASERIAIKTSIETDPVIADFFSLLEDPRLREVNLSLQSVKDALDYLQTKKIISAARKDEILQGNVI